MLRTLMVSAVLATCFSASFAHAAAPDPATLQKTYQAQLTALANSNESALAATLDSATCESLKSLFKAASEKHGPTLALLVGAPLETIEGLPACTLLAKATLRLSTQSPALSGNAPSTELVGVVLEGNSVAHAVMRTTYKVRGTALQLDELVSFKQNGTTWKIGSNTLVTSLATALKSKGF